MIRILFLIRSLELGGTERQLVELVKGLDRDRFRVMVVTFYDGGALLPELTQIGSVEVRSLHKKSRWDVFPFFSRLLRTARQFEPHIVHSFMGISGEISLLIGKVLQAKVVWGLRSSYVDFSRYDWATRWSFQAGAWLSSSPDLIIVNSWAGQQHFAAHGYCAERMVVIPNGIDVDRFRPDPISGQRVRADWGIGRDDILVGLVGRLDPMKDHPTFLRAASLMAKARNDARFVCVGSGPSPYKAELLTLSEALGLPERLVWAGTRTDMPAVYNSFDIAVSSSCGEGFPNAIAEAMACGVTCVVTDVGDSARIVGDTGVVVKARDPESLFHGLETCLPRVRDAKLAMRTRQRIEQEFGRERLAQSMSASLEGLLQAVP